MLVASVTYLSPSLSCCVACVVARAITVADGQSLGQHFRAAIAEYSDYRDTVAYCPSVRKSSTHHPPSIFLRALGQS